MQFSLSPQEIAYLHALAQNLSLEDFKKRVYGDSKCFRGLVLVEMKVEGERGKFWQDERHALLSKAEYKTLYDKNPDISYCDDDTVPFRGLKTHVLPSAVIQLGKNAVRDHWLLKDV